MWFKKFKILVVEDENNMYYIKDRDGNIEMDGNSDSSSSVNFVFKDLGYFKVKGRKIIIFPLEPSGGPCLRFIATFKLK